MLKKLLEFLGDTGIAQLFKDPKWFQYLAMYVIIGALFYLAIVKKFEPLLLMPIAFGMLLANLPGANLMHLDMFFDEYYITVQDGQISGTLAAHMQNFLYYLDINGLSDLYSVTNDSIVFNLSSLTEDGVAAFN